MGTTAKIIAISYLALVVVGIALALALVRTTRTRRQVDPEKLAHRERSWLVVVVALLVALLFATIFFIPYGAEAGPNKQVVRVDSLQFGWTIEPGTVQADVPVEFVITSQDVNHGFGVYDAENRLVFQVQAVPGKEQKAVWTPDDPGEYTVLCLEFCGVGHHLMQGRITVEEGQT